jgi:hypothetical protein
MSDLKARASEIQSKLLQGGRGITKYSEEEMELLEFELGRFSVGQQDWGHLKEMLFLLDHSSTTDRRFEPGLLQLLKRHELEPDLLIFILNVSRKHIITTRFKDGQRLDFAFLEALQKLIYHPDPEVVEWVLRTIEECGTQGVYFLKDLDKIKPPVFKLFNKHYRAIREIIAMLERRWRAFETR